MEHFCLKQAKKYYKNRGQKHTHTQRLFAPVFRFFCCALLALEMGLPQRKGNLAIWAFQRVAKIWKREHGKHYKINAFSTLSGLSFK